MDKSDVELVALVGLVSACVYVMVGMYARHIGKNVVLGHADALYELQTKGK